MSPTPQMYSWTSNQSSNSNSSDSSKSTSNQGWSQSNSSAQGWNCNSSNTSGLNSQQSASSGFSSSFSSGSSFVFNSNKSNNNNNSSGSALPKFQETFDVSTSWSDNSSRRGSMESGSIFGNPKKKVDWDGEVEKVFLQEIGRASQELQSKQTF